MIILDLSLFIIGILLGIFYTSMLILPLFYGIPKAFVGFLRNRIKFRAILAYLVAPFFWTVFFTIGFFILANFWKGGFDFLRESGSFNLGQSLGSLILVLNVLFSRKTRQDMNLDFEQFVKPYRK